jgi:hypothetical protein
MDIGLSESGSGFVEIGGQDVEEFHIPRSNEIGQEMSSVQGKISCSFWMLINVFTTCNFCCQSMLNLDLDGINGGIFVYCKNALFL